MMCEEGSRIRLEVVARPCVTAPRRSPDVPRAVCARAPRAGRGDEQARYWTRSQRGTTAPTSVTSNTTEAGYARHAGKLCFAPCVIAPRRSPDAPRAMCARVPRAGQATSRLASRTRSQRGTTAPTSVTSAATEAWHARRAKEVVSAPVDPPPPQPGRTTRHVRVCADGRLGDEQGTSQPRHGVRPSQESSDGGPVREGLRKCLPPDGRPEPAERGNARQRRRTDREQAVDVWRRPSGHEPSRLYSCRRSPAISTTVFRVRCDIAPCRRCPRPQSNPRRWPAKSWTCWGVSTPTCRR